MILCAADAGMDTPDKGFDLEMEGDFAEHLGIGMQQRDNRTICMTQKGLIEKIISTAKMKKCNPSKTPAPTAAPGLDAKCKPWEKEHWGCASVVRMLLCALNNTGPDITKGLVRTEFDAN